MPRPTWTLCIALACAAMAFMVLLGAVRAGANTRVADRAVTAVDGSPSDRASARIASTTRAAWQRGGGRRTQRTASSTVPGAVRAAGIFARSVRDQRSGAAVVERANRYRRDARLGSAPTRAPPTHR